MKEVTVDALPVEGPDGLRSALVDLYTKSKLNPQFAQAEHYILYQLGEQKALLKVDFSHSPQFYYNDLLGRPITRVVKEVIARFLWEECGQREPLSEEEV